MGFGNYLIMIGIYMLWVGLLIDFWNLTRQCRGFWKPAVSFACFCITIIAGGFIWIWKPWMYGVVESGCR